MVVSVRGAIQIDVNSPEAIFDGAKELVCTLMEKNNISEDALISVQFSQTRDLNTANPATALRSLGFSDIPLWCVQELHVVGGMERVIRLLLTLNWDNQERPKPVYLKGAQALRPDLAEE